MRDTNTAEQSLPLDEQAPVEETHEHLVEEIAEDSRRDPETWLRDAEVPKGGE